MTKTIAIIPARKGSKRFPGKNRKKLGGKYMIDYTMEVALKCDFIDEIVFVSDDPELLQHAEVIYGNIKGNYGGIHIISEDPKIAQDGTEAWEVVRFTIEQIGLELENPNIIYLQPTSPFMDKANLYEAWHLYNHDYTPVASVKYQHKWKYRLNGAIYISNYTDIIICQSLWSQAEQLMVMSEMNSYHIDTKEDWENAKIYLQRKTSKIQ